MKLRSISLIGIMVLVCTSLSLAAVLRASADTVIVNFTADSTTLSPWQFACSNPACVPPFGLAQDPSLSGQVTIDTTKTDGTAFIGLDWVTGSRTWTLSDISIAQSSVWYFPDGQLASFLLQFVTSDWGTNAISPINTAAIFDGTTEMYCNGCVTSSVSEVPLPAVPLPAALPLFATGLGALGLLGWGRKRKAIDA